jgi:hypothetical protein
MYENKSKRIFENDFTCSEHAVVIGWIGGVIEERLPSLGCHSIYQGSSAFFACALTVNVIGLLFLRQCFVRRSPSTETSISGTSLQLPICRQVSQNVYWRMT